MANTAEGERRDLLKAAVVKIAELEARLAGHSSAREPIAIIGIGCRLPGGADTPDLFWDQLSQGLDAMEDVPADRWDLEALYDSRPATPGRMYTRQGGFVGDVAGFDPAVFGISPREAASMDPQHRLLLEVSWHALEHAGRLGGLAGSRTGVFAGMCGNDYSLVQLLEGDLGAIDTYFGAGIAHSIASGRLSYVLGLQGPSLSVDTACSSSLLAVHLACLSLRAGECDMALAGGVNLMLTPVGTIAASQARMLAPDGRCKTFDASADGYVRAEGCAMIVLKPLAAAQRDRDRILAVVRGSAANQDGRSNGLTAPNGRAQEAVIARALADAGVRPAEIDYVEAHGTGTALGDPIEVHALGAALGCERREPLLVGSVKSNIGHLEAAAGVAGLIKLIGALHRQQIPPTLHVRQLNPNVAWSETPVRPVLQLTAWPRGARRRLGGVSSFGFSGTNVHLVVEEGPVGDDQAAGPDEPEILPIAAKSATTLDRMTGDYARWLPEAGSRFADICFTAGVGRAHLEHRVAVVARTAAEAAGILATGAATPGRMLRRGVVPTAGAPKIAFLFSGQGAQHAGMGRRLYESSAVARRTLDRCDALLREQLGTSLLALMFEDDGRLAQTRFTQPALFAIEIALADCWRAWGIVPQAVGGHSLGEYVAATVAGVFTLEEGLTLAAARGRLMQSAETGDMIAVFAAPAQVEPYLRGLEADVSLAAVNGPTSVVVAGRHAAIAALESRLGADGLATKRLNVSHAFHSPLMDPVLPAFRDVASRIPPRAPAIDFVSNLTGRLFAPGELADADYWVRHIRRPVAFADGMAALAERGYGCFVEVGPGATLAGLGRRCLPSARWLTSLDRTRDDREQMLATLAELYVAGADVEWAHVTAGGSRRVGAPQYAFERERYWVQKPAPSVRPAAAAAPPGDATHPILSAYAAVAGEPARHAWWGELSLARFPFLRDHQVQGVVVVPAATYMEAALGAATQLLGPGDRVILATTYHTPIVLEDATVLTLQVVLERTADEEVPFRLFSRRAGTANAPWSLHCTGRLAADSHRADAAAETGAGGDGPGAWSAERLDGVRARCGNELSGTEFYDWLAEKGNQWGPLHQGVERLWRGDGEALGRLRVPQGIRADFDRFTMHPAVGDACGHVLAALVGLHRSEDSRGGAFVGAGVDRIHFIRHPDAAGFWVYARLRPEAAAARAQNVLEGDIEVFDDSGAVVLALEGVRFCYLESGGATRPAEAPFYDIVWEPRPAPATEPRTAAGAWLVLADRRGIGAALAARLRAQGIAVVVADAGGTLDGTGDRFVVRPSSREDIDVVMRRAFADAGRRCAGIVHLWGVDLDDEQADSTGAGLGCGSLLAVCQAAEGASSPGERRLWVATLGAQQVVSGETVQCRQAALWGFGRSLALEASDQWGGLVDLDPLDAPAAAAAALAGAIVHRSGEQLAFRSGVRHVARLVPLEPGPDDEQPLRCRTDGAYLITGGMGGLGLAVAGRLVERGARRLILLGRTPLPARTEWAGLPADSLAGQRVAAIRALERAGAAVHVAAADVGDAAQVEDFLAQYRLEGWPPVRGVVHAAGVMQYEAVARHTLAAQAAILRPKVEGTLALERALGGDPLDFFVLFSSASSVISSPLMASYAGGNAFLDAVARRRRSAGRTAVSINWPSWADTGMALAFDGGDRAAQSASMRAIGTAEGLDLLERAIMTGAAQVAVLPIDWSEWRKRQVFQREPLLARFMSPDQQPARAAALTRAALAEASPAERSRLLVDYVAQLLAQVLAVPAERLAADVPVVTLGFDSLMAVEVKNQIETDLQLVVPMVQIVSGPTAGELAALVDALASAGFSGAAGRSTPDHLQPAAAGAHAAFEEGEL